MLRFTASGVNPQGMKGFLIIILTTLSFSTAVPYPQTINDILPVLEIDFTWSTESLIKRKSPYIRLTNIPSGTEFLRISFTNLQLSGIRQRGSIIKYTGRNILEEGSLEGIALPPRIPDKEGLTEYRLTVIALDHNQQPIARGTRIKSIKAKPMFHHRTLSINEIIVM